MPNVQKADWPTRLLRLVVDVALALHFAAAAAWWWLSPKGFPLNHAQFWTNTALPIATMLFALAGLWAMHRGNVARAALVVLYFAAAWIAAAIAARLYFPISLAGKWLAVFAVGLVGTMLFGLLVRGNRVSKLMSSVAVIVGAGIGTGAIWLQVPQTTSTSPLNESPTDASFVETDDFIVQIGDGVSFQAESATLAISKSGIRLSCVPLLTFDRISPDRFWSLLAPRGSATARRCVAKYADAAQACFRYDDKAIVVISMPDNYGQMHLTAYSPVEADTYSHLNTFCELHVQAAGALSLTFSPCGNVPIDIVPADYPIGRPARMACFDESGRFRVVEATSAEKGPFRTLAAGTLARGEPVTITIWRDADPVASVTLHDWATQASTDLSPTAGWRFPINAIEFQRDGNSASAAAYIRITLAATSVGRGYDTVGHRAGIYRNRITIDTLMDD